MTHLEKMLQPDSQYVFYDDQHGFCINTDDVLMLLQPERKKGEWIPVSERFPEKPNMYTVTDSKGDVVRFVFYDNESSREYWRRCAKAWMPLPEPYKGD